MTSSGFRRDRAQYWTVAQGWNWRARRKIVFAGGSSISVGLVDGALRGFRSEATVASRVQAVRRTASRASVRSGL
ncbi:MAG: hypothetical protein OXI87_10740 [Albidovulum sp.]|nr:hypothetical protein [Albidovulum sp.]